jgi:hypothetical protein
MNTNNNSNNSNLKDSATMGNNLIIGKILFSIDVSDKDCQIRDDSGNSRKIVRAGIAENGIKFFQIDEIDENKSIVKVDDNIAYIITKTLYIYESENNKYTYFSEEEQKQEKEAQLKNIRSILQLLNDNAQTVEEPVKEVKAAKKAK